MSTTFYQKKLSGDLSIRSRSSQPALRRLYPLVLMGLALLMVAPLLFLEYKIDLARNWASILSFCCIGLWAFAALYKACLHHPFTLNTSHWVFVLFFFFYAPLVQFLADLPPAQTDGGFFGALHFEANSLILVWCCFYSIVYKLAHQKAHLRRESAVAPSPGTPWRINYVVLVALSVMATLIAIRYLGFEGATARFAVTNRLTEVDADSSAKPLTLIVNIVCRALPVVAFLLLLRVRKTQEFYFWVSLIVVGACMLFLNHPFAVARFWFGALLIGILNTLLRRRRMSGLWLPVSLVVAFLVVLPVLDLGRNVIVTDAQFDKYEQPDLVSRLTYADFDAYSMVINTMAYTQQTGFSYGGQLLGNILFFVPRAFWSDKPDGSGVLVGEYFGFVNTNLSQPLPAEAYLNFGIIGVVVYAALFAALLARLDHAFWRAEIGAAVDDVSFLRLVYPLLVGFVLFMMRGDFLSSFAYTLGFLFAAHVMLRFSLKKHLKGNMARRVAPRDASTSRLLRLSPQQLAPQQLAARRGDEAIRGDDL